MSIVEIYNPKFDTFHDQPIIVWKDKHGHLHIQENMLEQYRLWKTLTLKEAKREPCPAFWETNGPAIVRAVMPHGASALIFSYVSDRKVSYSWVVKKGRDTFYICPVRVEGGRPGGDTSVTVTLPTDEDVHVTFRHDTMKEWLKPAVTSMAEEPRLDQPTVPHFDPSKTEG